MTIRELAARIVGFVRRRRPGGDLGEELQVHLEMMEQQFVREGMDPAAAHREARARFGGATQIAEAYHDQQTLPLLEMVVQDARYGVRMLLRSPGFTTAALLTLALGIGANAAMFSLVNHVLLRPLPYADSHRLVALGDRSADGGVEGIGFATFQDIRDRTRAFDAVVAIRSWAPTLVLDNVAERVSAMRVSWNFFQMLGARPALGRDFEREEDRPGRLQVVIISDGLWRRRFKADSAVIGRTVRLSDVDFRIVGVLPPDFEPLISQRYYQRAEMWAPLGYDTTLPYACRTCQHLKALGRVGPRVNFEQAAADLNAIRRQLAAAFPAEYPSGEMSVVPLTTVISGRVRPALLVLFAAVGFVLLIACANVANLLLARAVTRAREMAVRAALGAGRWRLVRQLLTESTILSVAGGVLGVALAGLILKSLDRMAPVVLPRADRVTIDAWALLFTSCVSVITGILFGVAPALRLSAFHLPAAFATDPRTSARSSTSRTRRGLVVADVALALVLLTGAGLMFRTVNVLVNADPGFNPSGVLTLQFSLLGRAYAENSSVVAFQDRLLERVRALPGVEAAAIAGQIPMGGNGDRFGLRIEGLLRPNPADDPSAERYSVTPDYFRVMQIRPLRGRVITESDANTSMPVMVISESTARLWEGEDPLGRRVRIGGSNAPWRTVVGIVADVHHSDLTSHGDPQIYLPQSQFADPFLVLTVRGGTAADRFAAPIRQIVRDIDPAVPVYRVEMLDRLVARSFADRLFVTQVLTSFALLALLLAAVGLYGVIAYTVSERTREVGLRIALGASRNDVLLLVFGAGMRTVCTGLAVGIAAALLLARFLQAMLYEVSPYDPRTIVAAIGLLIVVTAAAHLLPVRRALRVDPAIALRND